MDTLTTNQLTEIYHALHYAEVLKHPTPGSNHLYLIAALAKGMGFRADFKEQRLYQGGLTALCLSKE